MRLVLFDDDAEHELLLSLMARSIDASVVARVSDLETLATAMDTLQPDALIVDLWIGGQRSLDHLDAILALAKDCGVVVWTYDPWSARPYLVDTKIQLVDKMSNPQDLLRTLEAVT